MKEQQITSEEQSAENTELAVFLQQQQEVTQALKKLVDALNKQQEEKEGSNCNDSEPIRS